MIFLFLLAWPFIEIYLFIKVVEQYGLFNAFMATLTAFFFGLLIIKAQSRTFLMKVQNELSQGRVPAFSVINSALLFLGGLMICIPGFFSDIIGVLLVLPGTRHLFVIYVRAYFTRKLANGTFKVFTSNFGSRFGQQGPFNQNTNLNHDERDVSPRVIDVTPISSSEERE